MIQDKTHFVTLATSLLAWYDRFGRELPWRVKGMPHPNPYHVWLSEIMLQQTTVATVKSYFKKFITLWPNLEDFAQAPLDDVLHAWQGLGYYARARNMVKCAQIVAQEHQGKFPQTAQELEHLPGIGPYTAAAVAAIAFEDQVTPIDGNVIRVLSRIFALQTPLPQSLKELTTLTKSLTPLRRTGDFAQALMDLGATICTPRKPNCLICPWKPFCQGQHQGIAEELPRKLSKPVKPSRYAVAFVISNNLGEFLFGRRPETGLLGGMIEIPTTPWRFEPWHDLDEAYAFAPLTCSWQEKKNTVSHSFTHFNFDITVIYGHLTDAVSVSDLPFSMKWVKKENFGNLALPTVMKKILKPLA